jgi:hypothetical protein
MPPAGFDQPTSVRLNTSGTRMVVGWRNSLETAGLITLHDRSGARTDSMLATQTWFLRWTAGERGILLPLTVEGSGSVSRVSMLRVAVDSKTGRFGKVDTLAVAAGVSTSSRFDLSADGRSLVYGAGRDGESVIWARSSLAGAVALTSRKVVSSSRRMDAVVSRDGRTILFSRATAVGDSLGVQWFAVPFDSGAERPVTPPMATPAARATDGRRLLLAKPLAAGRTEIVSYAVESGRQAQVAVLPGEIRGIRPGPHGGVALVNVTGDSVRMLDSLGRVLWTTVVPDSLGRIDDLLPSPDGSEYLSIAQPVSLVIGADGNVVVSMVRLSATSGTLREVARLNLIEYDEYEWADDGWLHFKMARAGEPAMRHYRIPAGGGEARVVGDAPAGHCSPSGDVHRWVCASNQVLHDIFVLRSTEPIR